MSGFYDALEDMVAEVVDVSAAKLPDLTTNDPSWQCADVAIDDDFNAWICTRTVGHTLRHAAGDGTIIQSTWRQ